LDSGRKVTGHIFGKVPSKITTDDRDHGMAKAHTNFLTLVIYKNVDGIRDAHAALLLSCWRNFVFGKEITNPN
jgi:hypothetical protein